VKNKQIIETDLLLTLAAVQNGRLIQVIFRNRDFLRFKLDFDLFSKFPRKAISQRRLRPTFGLSHLSAHDIFAAQANV
jgi:hypothetical protein